MAKSISKPWRHLRSAWAQWTCLVILFLNNSSSDKSPQPTHFTQQLCIKQPKYLHNWSQPTVPRLRQNPWSIKHQEVTDLTCDIAFLLPESHETMKTVILQMLPYDGTFKKNNKMFTVKHWNVSTDEYIHVVVKVLQYNIWIFCLTL